VAGGGNRRFSPVTRHPLAQEAIGQHRFLRFFGGETMMCAHRNFAGLLLGFCLLAWGCGGKPKVIVHGLVTLDGQPLDGAQVGFVPENSALPGGGATTKSKGEFEIVPYKNANVLEPGVYAVTVNKLELPPKMQAKLKDLPPDSALAKQMSGALGPMGPAGVRTNVVPPQYRAKERTPLKVTLKAGLNELEPFELKSRKSR